MILSSVFSNAPASRPLPQSALEVYKEMVLLYLEGGRRQVNSHCADLEPWQIIGATVLSTLGALWVKGFLFQRESNVPHVHSGSSACRDVAFLWLSTRLVSESARKPKVRPRIFVLFQIQRCHL